MIQRSEAALTGSSKAKTAAEAGWRVSRYNLSLELPEKGRTAIVNLFRGTCKEYGLVELYLMSVLDEISEDHPIISMLAKTGVIVNFDEQAALETMGRMACADSRGVGLTICPTMGCNFDCPYCFENHKQGKMTEEVQADTAALAERLLKTSRAKSLSVTWFGGEPLLAPDVIESLSEKLMALAEEHHAEYSAGIITNGYLLTPEVVKMLEKAQVKSAQITLDGIGAAHDATRHLRGGGPTFERIVENLRQPIPFKVSIRHNVHEGNRDEVGQLKAFVEDLAKETGNAVSYYPAPVTGSEAAEKRGSQVDLIGEDVNCQVGILQDSGRFTRGSGHYCGAHLLFSVCIDEKGRLTKCWEAVDKESISFGNARDWDPADPLRTASNPDRLTMFLNTAAPLSDEECRECIWLPACRGGCPWQRLFRGRKCLPYRDAPDAYVRSLVERMKIRN